MSRLNRLSAKARAVLFIGDRSFRVDLTDPIGGIPDWVLWRVDAYKYCTLQEYINSPAEVLYPRFDLVLWENNESGYTREHALVVLCALEGTDLYLGHRMPHYEQTTTIIRNLSYEQMVRRTTDNSRRNLRRKLDWRKAA